MAANGDADEITPQEKKICEQIEYYFGDHNLPRDKFLTEQIKLDDGWVPLETMIKFNRLSRLTTDFPTIVEALKKSKSGLMEISEDKSKVRRVPSKPLPEMDDKYKDSVKAKTVYVKGFPTSATLDEIMEWFEEKGPGESIQMRRTLQKQFKGSVFVVYDSVEKAKKFVETSGLKYKETDMIVLFKEAYFAKKAEEKQNRGSKNKKHDKQEIQKIAEESMKKSMEEKSGCLLAFSGDLTDQTCREDIHEVFSNHGEIRWVDFTRGAKEGNILFKTSAKEALEKAKEAHDGNLQLRGKDVTWGLLEGDEEKKILKKIMEDQEESLNKRKGRGQWGRGRGRSAKGGRRQTRVKFQGKKTTFDSEEEDGGGDGMEETEETAPTNEKKRQFEETKSGDEPASKQMKVEETEETEKEPAPKVTVTEPKKTEEPALKEMKTEEPLPKPKTEGEAGDK
uniref:Autoantigen La n=1 Tax=Callorhinchus milii TaxID=7868 RepID=V9KN76_CALMI